MEVNVDEFGLRLFVIFLPGLLGHYLLAALTVHRTYALAEVVLRALLIGLISYLPLIPIVGDQLFVVQFLADPDVARTTGAEALLQAGLATIPSVFLSSLWALACNRKLLVRAARLLRITKRTGEIDVWGFSFNSDLPNWVVVRDLNNNLMYEGWAKCFSDDGHARELLLGDTRVSQNDSGKPLYNLPAIYLPLDGSCFSVEWTQAAFDKSLWKNRDVMEASNSRKEDV
jgi:hypothetical protein